MAKQDVDYYGVIGLKDEDKSREQLLVELSELRRHVEQLEAQRFAKQADHLEAQQITPSVPGDKFGLVFSKSPDEVIRLSQTKVFQIFNSVPDPMSLTLLQDGLIVEVNDAWQEFHGYKNHEVKGRTTTELQIWTTQRRNAFLKLMAEHGEIRSWETSFRLKSGEIRTGLFSAAIIEDGGLKYVFSVFKDISERKNMEEALRLSQDKFSKVFYSSPDPMSLSLLKDGRFIEVNNAMLEGLGYKRDEVIGHTAEELKIWADGGRERLLILTEQQCGIHNWETKFYNKSGEVRFGLFSAEIIEIDKQKYVLSLIKDITRRKKIEEALRVSEEKFSRVFNYSPDPMTLLDLDSRCYVEINDAFIEVMGYERAEIIGKTAEEIGIWIDKEARHNLMNQAMENGKINNLETRFRIKNGDVAICLYSAEVLEIGGSRFMVSIAKDITERKKMEEELRLSEDKFSKAFETSLIGMTITRLRDGKLLAANNKVCQLSGYTKEEIIGKTSLDINFWEHKSDREFIIGKIAAGKAVKEMEILCHKKDGELRIGSYSAEAININGELCILNMIVDISDRKKSEAEIRYLSYHDKLTGLYNRAFFEEQLQRMAYSRQTPFSLILGDINGLKIINDALGDQAGDRLLIDMAEIFKKFCREQDVVARWGGDEFIIMMPNCDSRTAARIMARIRAACRQLNSIPIKSSISLGMSTLPSPGLDVREVLKEAEDKMYRNKLLDDRSNRSSFLVSLEQTLWSRSNETEEHCRRLQDMAQGLGRAASLSESEMDDLRLLALLHDIGKIAIPNSILDKPGKLTSEEWDAIKKHPEIGYRIALSSPDMAPIAHAILHHHERWDGCGYPLGIKEEEIPLLSRIISIADAFDVMINGRPYQEPLSPAEAWDEIERCAGSQFDPELVMFAKHLYEEGYQERA